MMRLSPLMTGVFFSFAASWLGVVAYAYVACGRLEPVADPNTGDPLPPPLSGLAAAGQRVYAANGCVTCHTQQVRPPSVSMDVEKKIGARATVPRDYVRTSPAFLGTLRIGPDLANAGLRSSDPNWFHRHLFEPSTVTPGSNMPSYRYLYITRAISGEAGHDAVPELTGPHAPQPGFEVIPGPEARALVAYLLSLKRDYPLPEAPLVAP